MGRKTQDSTLNKIATTTKITGKINKKFIYINYNILLKCSHTFANFEKLGFPVLFIYLDNFQKDFPFQFEEEAQLKRRGMVLYGKACDDLRAKEDF